MIEISDHAVLRYLERVEGYDIDALKNELAKEVNMGAVKFAGGSVIKQKTDCCTFVIKDGRVLTVIKN